MRVRKESRPRIMAASWASKRAEFVAVGKICDRVILTKNIKRDELVTDWLSVALSFSQRFLLLLLLFALFFLTLNPFS
jgi:hypothetical protein